MPKGDNSEAEGWAGAVKEGLELGQKLASDDSKSGGKSTSGGSGKLSDVSARQAAFDMAAGLRKRNGEPTAEGKKQGLKPLPDATARKARQILNSELGSGGAQAAPQPPASPGGQQTPGSPPEPDRSMGPSGYPAAPQIEEKLPIKYGTDLPQNVMSWTYQLVQWIVDKMGLEGADDWLSFVAQLLGRTLPEPDDERGRLLDCQAEILIEHLDEEKREVARQWQCGMDEPLVSGDQEEAHQLWLMLTVATSAYDLQTGQQTACIRPSNPYD